MKKLLAILALMASALLSGCATPPGPFNGLGSDEMGMLIVYTTNGVPPTKSQYDYIAVIAKSQGAVLDWQLSSAAESGAVGFGAYGLAGAAGGATQGHFYPGAAVGPAAGYTGVVYGLGGLVSGLISASYANVHALATMVETTLRDRSKTRKDLEPLHVAASFIRSKNTTGAPAKGLRDYMPEFSGPRSGTPVQPAPPPPPSQPRATVREYPPIP